MTRTLMIGSALAWLLGGCGQHMMQEAPGYAVSDFKCEKYVMTLTTCRGEEKKNKPEVEIDARKLTFDPENVCVVPGSKITFTLDPPPQNSKGSAAIVPKNPVDTWLVGTNANNPRKIEVQVPDWVSTRTQYDYVFITSAGKCVDPRVEVVE